MAPGALAPYSLKSAKFPIGVADFFGGDAHTLHHADVEAGEGGVVVGFEVTAGFELAVGTAGQDDRDVLGGVGIAIADAGSEKDHGVVEDVGAALGKTLHFLKQIGKLCGVPGVDLFVLIKLLRVALVVGDGMVASTDAIEEGEVLAGNGVAKHEGGDAGGIGPESERDEVEHEAGVLGVVDSLHRAEAFFAAAHGGADAFVQRGKLLGGGFADVLAGPDLIGFVFNPAFDFADTFEVLLELVLVLGAEGFLQRVGVVENDVDDGAVFRFALATAVGVSEEAIEGALRIDLAGKGDIGLFPGNVGSVKSGQIDIAVNAGGDGLGAEFHRGKLGVPTDGVGRDLVDGDSVGGDIRSGGAGDGRAGQPARGFIVVPVTLVGWFVSEATDDGEMFLDRLQRAQDGREFEGFPASAGSPFVGSDAIGHEEAGHADGVACRFSPGIERAHRFEEREGEGGAGAAEELAAGKLPAVALNVCHGPGC